MSMVRSIASVALVILLVLCSFVVGGSSFGARANGITGEEGCVIDPRATLLDHARKTEQPLFTVGVVADVQYADAEDGVDFTGNFRRQYRNSVHALERALTVFQQRNVSFIAQLGDLIDGRDALSAQKHWETIFEPLFEKYGYKAGAEEHGPDFRDVHFLVGNHELYCWDRDELDDALYTQRGDHHHTIHGHYYSFVPEHGWKFIVLDPFDISTLNRKKHLTDHALEHLEPQNPGVMEKDNWLEGLDGLDRRWMPFNGAISPAQLEWLRKEVGDAVENQQRVVVMSHVSIYPDASTPDKLIWNYDEVLAILHSAPRGTVVSCLYGHAHQGGYAQDAHGIHHKTVEAILEAREGDAYAVLEVFADRVEVRGGGAVDDATWEFAGPTLDG